jgi:hypothetical protein
MFNVILSSLEWSSVIGHPVVIALAIPAVAAFVAAAVVRQSRPQVATCSPQPLAISGSSAAGPGPVILPFQYSPGRADRSYARDGDRRSSLRRKARPVPVLVHRPEQPSKPELAWVVDRSCGGVQMVLNRELPTGHEFAVRAENSPDELPWIKLRVRHCRASGKRWLVGCQFVDQLPWSVLLLFG